MNDIHDLDLNLLRTFDALMEHRSVTRAASHLGVTQPAVSHALARLRRLLNDPLFVRAQNGLQPTARAEEIADGVSRGLRELGDALAPRTFDPATASRRFTLATTSYFNVLLVPALIELVRAEAPGIGLNLVPSSDMLIPLLDRGAIDLALGAAITAPARIVIEPLYREQMVWIAAPGNPIVRMPPPPDAMMHATQIAIVPGQPFGLDHPPVEDLSGAADQPSAGGAASHPSRITVYDSQTAIALVARTDLVARVPERMAERAVAEGRVAKFDRIEDGSYQMAILWHTRRQTDQGLSWLRDRIRSVAEAPPAV